MNKELILKSDLLDIVFQNRNKAYGAYPLRKFYPSRLKRSLLIMFISAGLLSAFTFLPSRKEKAGPIFVEQPTFRTIGTEIKPEQPKPKSPAAPKPRVTAAFTNVFKIVPDKDSTQKLIDITNYEIGSKTIIDVVDATDGRLVGELPGTGKEPEQPQVAAAPEKPAPIDNPDVQASFPGGQKELIRFLERNLRSPKDIEEGQTVQVQVKFVVDFDGDLQSFDVVKDGGEEFNKEVVRVLKKMPKWNPGKKGGQSIPVYYTIPVKFTSNE